MPDFVYNWLVNFFQGHTQCTKFANVISPLSAISASVIQGSAIGPASFLVCASDLHPVHPGNRSNKYADDVYLIIPASNTHTCQSELDHVAEWAKKNNLKLKAGKSQEMIVVSKFARSNKVTSLPPLLPNISRVDSMIILGVTVSSNIRMTKHVQNKIQNCSKSLFALKKLKAHGKPSDELQNIFVLQS